MYLCVCVMLACAVYGVNVCCICMVWMFMYMWYICDICVDAGVCGICVCRFSCVVSIAGVCPCSCVGYMHMFTFSVGTCLYLFGMCAYVYECAHD